jgi:hypothetical protein
MSVKGGRERDRRVLTRAGDAGSGQTAGAGTGMRAERERETGDERGSA